MFMCNCKLYAVPCTTYKNVFMKFYRLSVLILLFLVACSPKKEDFTLQEGIWNVSLTVQDSEQLPFNFKSLGNSLEIYNAEEVIVVDNITIQNDSITIQMPIYEGVLKGKFIDKNRIEGQFIKASLDRFVPFTAVFGEANRFKVATIASEHNISGNWETIFSPESTKDSYIAKGIFKQNGNKVTGTFRTTTGDYRYLEGVVNGNTMRLSTFDGAHAFLFTATVTDSTMTGQFYSGNHWKEPFTAKRNENYELPNPEDLTFIKEGYDTFDFSFPDANGKMISVSDEAYQNKVRVVQIMGTWCPNCLDESKYYSAFANKNPDIEFIALAFEYAKTKEKAFQNIKRLQQRLNIPYPILLAQYGTSNKQKAQEKLPMLNHVLSYPTTIFLDKKGNVRKIHTGFNGPATGEKYLAFKKDFEDFIKKLSSES